jgi:hypothetical protein
MDEGFDKVQNVQNLYLKCIQYQIGLLASCWAKTTLFCKNKHMCNKAVKNIIGRYFCPEIILNRDFLWKKIFAERELYHKF